MNKCYVIKNKLADNFELNWCTIYPTKQDAELTISLHQLKNCEVVECTICEGDLEKELEELKAKYETAEYWSRRYDNCQQELEVYKRAFDQMAVEYAIVNGLTDVRDVQYAILDIVREEIEREKKDE